MQIKAAVLNEILSEWHFMRRENEAISPEDFEENALRLDDEESEAVIQFHSLWLLADQGEVLEVSVA